jgi:hypothetical protein
VYAYDNTKPITTYLYSKFIEEKTSKGTYGDKVEALLGIPNTDIEHMIKIGEEMISIVENTTKRIFNNHTPPVYNETLGYEIVTINSPVFQSELGNLGYDKYPNAVIVVYNINLSIGKVILSLRSHNDGPNVAEIAEKFGGGGHAHAAGFSIPVNKFGREEGDGGLTKKEVKHIKERSKAFIESRKKEGHRLSIWSPSKDVDMMEVLYGLLPYDYDIIVLDYISLLRGVDGEQQ